MKYNISVYECNLELLERCFATLENPASIGLDELKVCEIEVSAKSKREALAKAHEINMESKIASPRSFDVYKVQSRFVALSTSLVDPPLPHVLYR